MRRTVRPAVTAAALALLLAGCGATEADEDTAAGAVTTPASPSSAEVSPSPSAGEASSSAPATTPGTYLTLAEYEEDPSAHAGTKVVLFFHAPWCPSCRATEQAIGTSGVPDGLTLVKVDFDTETALRQEYGVTYQHTFVQVDPEGTQLARWTGSEDGEAILDNTV
jgi:thioredoxin 1